MLEKHFGVALLLIGLVLAWPATTLAAPAHQAGCTFKLGFKALYDQIPDIVGVCVSDEYWNALGDSNQQTRKGLMAWRAADNWTAFTNGATTWINGPYGVASRPNEGPFFAWESRAATNPPYAPRVSQPLPRAAAPPAAPAPAPPPAPNAFVGDTVTYGQWQLTLEKFHRDTELPNSPSKQSAKAIYPKGVFITVILTAKNLGSASSGLPKFKLADSRGRLFDQDGYAGLYGGYKHGAESGYIVRIQPSLSSKVAVGFDVAPDAEGFVLRVVV